MKTWKIPVTWKMYDTIEITAETLEEAISIFDKTQHEISLPKGEYIEDSFRRDSVEFCNFINELNE